MKKSDKSTTYEYQFQLNPHPGLFVVIEGFDGSGNSTQASKVNQRLTKSGVKVLLTKEPTSGPVGAMIRMALENRLKVDFSTLQMMFTVDRADHIKSKRGIEERLKMKEIVVSDRYLASTLAFGYGSNLDVGWLSVMQSKFFLPDVTFFLDVKPETCIKRIKMSRPGFDLFEKKDQLKKVYKGYKLVNKMLKNSFVKIEGEREIDEITDEIMDTIKKHYKYKKITKKSRT